MEEILANKTIGPVLDSLRNGDNNKIYNIDGKYVCRKSSYSIPGFADETFIVILIKDKLVIISYRLSAFIGLYHRCIVINDDITHCCPIDNENFISVCYDKVYDYRWIKYPESEQILNKTFAEII